MSADLFTFAEVPQQDRCRWFVRYGAKTVFDRGFRSKEEAGSWIKGFGHRVDWQAGYVFRLRGDNQDIAIVDRQGTIAKV